MVHRGIQDPHAMPLRAVLAYLEHMEDLHKRDHDSMKGAFAEPLAAALKQVLGG